MEYPVRHFDTTGGSGPLETAREMADDILGLMEGRREH
jgi:hypothetical protein